MLRIYLTEAIKNIKAKLTLSVIIVLLLIFLMETLSCSLSWATYHIFKSDSYEGTLRNEAYLEYSIYVLNAKSTVPDVRIRQKTYEYNPDDPENPIVHELSEEDVAYNENVVSSFEKLYQNLKNIDGLVLIDKTWGNIWSDNGDAYALSLQKTGKMESYAGDQHLIEFFSELGYTEEDVAQFCNYNCVQYSIDTLLMENFTYCEGRGWTEEDLDFEYMITEDGTLPTIPIVMGYDFKEYYNVGDVIQNPESDYEIKMFKEGYVTPGYYDQTYAKYLVIGFLDKGTNVESSSGIRRSLDNYIVIPSVPNLPDYFPNGGKKSMASEFYNYLLQKQVYIEKDREQQIVAELSRVLSEDNVRGTYLYPEKQSQVNAVYQQLSEKRLVNYSVISGGTLLFTLAVIILIIVTKFNKNIKDIAIHRLVGATISDQVKSYVLEYAIYLICADVLLHFEYILHKLNPHFSSLLSDSFAMSINIGGTTVYLMYPLIIVINVLILATVALIARICSSRLDTATIIKGTE